METNQEHLFDGPEYQLVQASGGKRFANYIIDLVVFYILAVVATMVILLIYPEKIDLLDEKGPEYTIIENLVMLGFMILYWFGIEAIFKGKTLGKLITGTRAVNEDGGNLTVKTAFLRALCRAIPFEPFSALGSPSYPWHDKLSKSYVIDEKESNWPTS